MPHEFRMSHHSRELRLQNMEYVVDATKTQIMLNKSISDIDVIQHLRNFVDYTSQNGELLLHENVASRICARLEYVIEGEVR